MATLSGPVICAAVSLLLLSSASDREMVEPVRGADTKTTVAGDSSTSRPVALGAIGLVAISPSDRARERDSTSSQTTPYPPVDVGAIDHYDA